VYLPRAFANNDRGQILDQLRRVAFGHLVTYGALTNNAEPTDEPALASTALPFVVDDGLTSVRAHLARANRHWQMLDADPGPALLIVPGLDAYVSPRWYPSKAEHGKVVPTWNYEVIHLHGTIQVHDDPEWTRQMVSDLTDQNERQLSSDDGKPAWEVSDAPADFVDGQLRAIVGIQLTIERVEAKQKLSQNRDAVDRVGAIEGLAASNRDDNRRVAALMRSAHKNL
jgi:transcriptional regulator